jgi:putative RNA 2'-phosphotransferase
LSKTISHALRHAPASYGLTLDETDSVALSDLVAAMRIARKEFGEIDEFDIVELTLEAIKVRHQIEAGRIRALYGHSVEQKRPLQAGQAPSILFHGTSPDTVAAILEGGLLPMARQYVHLSADLETARIVGRRKAPQPAIIEIQASLAEQTGEKFFRMTDKIWLAEKVEPQFLRLMD